MNPTALEQGRHFLAGQGLNLLAVFDSAGLPAVLREQIIAGGAPLDRYRRLLLAGHGGRRFWEIAWASGLAGADPLDHLSLELVRRFMTVYVKSADYFVLYPLTDILLPLQQLGELAGWAHPSPIGSGISPEYGLWFAYRAALLTNAGLPPFREIKRPSPCHSCPEKPCVSACPAGAVRETGEFGLQACASHRLAPRSACAARCLSRLACPVAPQHRYTEEQIRYHYEHSLAAIRRFSAGS